MPPIECRLSKLVETETHDQVIVLEEKDGKRQFPIMIGPFEVSAIHRFVHKERPPRPLTHELFGNVLKTLNVAIEKVIVTDLRNGIFYALLVLQQDGKLLEIDSRPSDAIALATQAGAPIFVEEEVLEKAAKDFE